MKTTIKHFSTYLTQIGYSEKTQIILPKLITDFFNYTKKTLVDIDKQDVINYYEYINTRPKRRGTGYLSESHISHHVYALNVFFSFQLAKGSIEQNPMSTLVFPRPRSTPREILTQEEVTTLFEACNTYRERAILALCYGLGLRRTEAENIKLDELDFKHLTAYVREGKGKRSRQLPMTISVSNHLKNYINYQRKAKPIVDNVLCSQSGNPMQGNDINAELKRIIERTDIKKKISLHSLRHSIATHLLENCAELDTVRDFLGHKHLETTQIYARVGHKKVYDLTLKKYEYE